MVFFADIKPGGAAAPASGSWLSRLWKRDSTGPVKASLGEESSFYYDANLKKWVNKKVCPQVYLKLYVRSLIFLLSFSLARKRLLNRRHHLHLHRGHRRRLQEVQDHLALDRPQQEYDLLVRVLLPRVHLQRWIMLRDLQ